MDEIDECLPIFYPNKLSYDEFMRLTLKHNRILMELYENMEQECIK